MFKRAAIFKTIVACFAMFGIAQATMISTGPAPYGTASHGNAGWQRLGLSQNLNDGVSWSINGGVFGNDVIDVGESVVFKFNMEKQLWGTHTFDALRAWIDFDQDGSYNDEQVFFQGQWNFNKDDPKKPGQQSYYTDNWWDGNRYYSGQQKDFFSNAITFNTAGDFNLRARVTCSRDLGGGSFPGVPANWSKLAPTGYLSQGEVEDYTFHVKQVPEPGTLWLLGMGVGCIPFIRRKKA